MLKSCKPLAFPGAWLRGQFHREAGTTARLAFNQQFAAVRQGDFSRQGQADTQFLDVSCKQGRFHFETVFLIHPQGAAITLLPLAKAERQKDILFGVRFTPDI